jgi:hypothetical protein
MGIMTLSHIDFGATPRTQGIASKTILVGDHFENHPGRRSLRKKLAATLKRSVQNNSPPTVSSSAPPGRSMQSNGSVPSKSFVSSTALKSSPYISDRIIWPRMLCFLDSASEENPYVVLKQGEWGERKPNYIFLSYTGEHFARKCRPRDPRCRCKYFTVQLTVPGTTGYTSYTEWY